MRLDRRLISALVAAGHLFVSCLAVLPTQVLAQSNDSEPPVIDFEPVPTGVEGETQVFSATVTDDEELDSVILHYRLDDSSSYSTLTMQPIGGTSIHTASVETARTDATVVQYYIEARDAAGNRSIQGFAFDPLERTLEVGNGVAVAELPASETVPSPGISTTQKVLYGLLGVIVVGGLAAAAGGGGSGGDGPRADDPNGIPLTITVDPLP